MQYPYFSQSQYSLITVGARILNVGKHVEKLLSSVTVDENINWENHPGKTFWRYQVKPAMLH